MIQIITSNMFQYNDFSPHNYTVSDISSFNSFDDFEINIVDLSRDSLWEYEGKYIECVNRYNDLKSIRDAINKSVKTNILFILPQNILYKYYKLNGQFDKRERLKNIIPEFKEITKKYLVDINGLPLTYGMTITTFDDLTIASDFSFNSSLNGIPKDNVIKLSDNGRDATIVKYRNRLYTTLKISNEEELEKILKVSFKECFDEKEDASEWIDEVDFLDDADCIDNIKRIDEEIDKLEKEKNNYNNKLKKNSEYKAILYETGDRLAKLVNQMMCEIFNYDMSEFEDEYDEDGRIELDDVTYIIESKGLTKDIKKTDTYKAAEHAVVYRDKYPDKNVRCLFFACYERNVKPSERSEIKEDIIKCAKNYEVLIIDTRQFLKLFEGYLNGDITVDTIKKKFDKTGKL